MVPKKTQKCGNTGLLYLDKPVLGHAGGRGGGGYNATAAMHDEGKCLPGALPFYQLFRLQPEIYPLMEKAPQIDHDGLRTFPTKHVA